MINIVFNSLLIFLLIIRLLLNWFPQVIHVGMRVPSVLSGINMVPGAKSMKVNEDDITHDKTKVMND